LNERLNKSRPNMRRIAVAALSARVLAETAAREGFGVVALDLFGDRDTHRAASRWQAIGDTSTLRIDDAQLLNALQSLAERDGVQGWIAGSGFDGRPELLRMGAERLPLIGNDAAAVQRVRDPKTFFATLDAHGIAHPAVLHEWPRDTSGWLLKDAGGCGGWQIRDAAAMQPTEFTATRYLQRQHPGTPMSATFIADGHRAIVLGCNEQLTRTVGASLWVFGGVIGPVPVTEAVGHRVEEALQVLVAGFGLRGLGSLDFLLHGQGIHVLELNPRPSASLELYAQADAGLMQAHLRACERGELQPAPQVPASPCGTAIVFARTAMQLSERAADWLAAQPDAHDLPQPHTRLARGDPLCSITAVGHDAAAVRSTLAQRCDTLLATLDNGP
jgi:uncharacterized protein